MNRLAYLSWTILALSYASIAQQKNQETCYVIEVKGEITLSDRLLQKGDTFTTKSFDKIIFKKNTYLSVYNKQYGAFKMDSIKAFKLSNPEFDYTEFISEIIGIDHENIPLSTRGNCKCYAFSCLRPDEQISRNVLLINTINVVPLEGAKQYFMQFEGGESVLLEKNTTGELIISRQQFLKEGKNEQNPKSVFIGSISGTGNNKRFDVLLKSSIYIVTETKVRDLFELYTSIIPDEDLRFQELINTVYILYGMPNRCKIAEIVGYELH